MSVFINIIICLLTILAFISCGYHALFRKTSLSKELDSIISSYESCEITEVSQQFTLFLAQRKLNYWNKVLKSAVGPSMLVSLIYGFVQSRNSLLTSTGWDEVKQFIENPGTEFYVIFLFVSYVAIMVVIIDQTIRSFSSKCKFK